MAKSFLISAARRQRLHDVEATQPGFFDHFVVEESGAKLFQALQPHSERVALDEHAREAELHAQRVRVQRLAAALSLREMKRGDFELAEVAYTADENFALIVPKPACLRHDANDPAPPASHHETAVAAFCAEVGGSKSHISITP